MSTKKIEHFMLPEHFNHLLPYEASTSLNLTRDVADKINEIVDTLNELETINVNEHFNQNAAIRKAVLYMKDNLLNSLNDLMVMLRDSGFIDDRIHEHMKELIDRTIQLTARLDNQIGALTEDSELIDLRTSVSGKSYANAGMAVREQLASLPIAMPAIEDHHEHDFNKYTDSGNYIIASYTEFQNSPSFFMGVDIKRYLIVEGYGERISDLGYKQTWGKQTIYTENGDKGAYRFYKWDYSLSDYVFTSWRNINHFNNYRHIMTAVDLNTIVEVDKYIVATGDTINSPYSGQGFLLEVKHFDTGWIVQEAYGMHINPVHYYRVANNPNHIESNSATDTGIVWSEWQQVMTASTIKNIISSVDTSFSNRGDVIVNMGDSIFGNFRDETSVSSFIANSTGATVHNFGFGGCRMSWHIEPWHPFSMYKLADAITSGDWSEQDAVLNHEEIPEYFKETISQMKAMDFSTVDIMTIAYGINDFTGGNTFDDEANKKNTDTFGGALRYSIEKILTRYPNIRIVLSTPCWCYWLENGSYSYDSDTHQINGRYLHEFVEKVISIGAEYHIPVVNPYDEMSVNKFNCSHSYIDGIHLNENGRKELAKLISNTIRGM